MTDSDADPNRGVSGQEEEVAQEPVSSSPDESLSVGKNEDGETVARLAPGVELLMRPVDDGVKIIVTEGGDETVYRATHARDFYTSAQKRRTLANELQRCTSDVYDDGEIANAFRDVCTALDEQHDEVEQALRPPTVQKLVEETTAVEYYRAGTNSHIAVHLTAEGREAAIEFTMGEWAHGGIGKLEEQYVAAFFPAEVEVTGEHWDMLKEEWREIATVIDGDDLDSTDVIAETVIDKLRERVGVPFDDRTALDRGKFNVVHEDDPAAQLDTDGAVLWVSGSALSDMVADVASHNVHADVVKVLRERGTIIGTWKRIGSKRLYPFAPDAFDYAPDALASLDDDDPEDLVGGEL